MFLINTNPLGSQKTLGDYATFLMKRFILPQFRKGTVEVHVIFDNPGCLQNSPKYFEHQQRDKTTEVASNHECIDFDSSIRIDPRKWRKNFINCRICKRKLVIFLGNYFLTNIGSYLKSDQDLYIAGAFSGDLVDTAWHVKAGYSHAQPDPAFTCNAEETDTRIWLHARKTRYNKIFLVSPDTDVYHIGLPFCTDKDILVKVSPLHTKEQKILNLTSMRQALQDDPHLASIDPCIMPKVLQSMYILTGCDYTSFFSQIGKTTFAKYQGVR